jgi:hypothetical protein
LKGNEEKVNIISIHKTQLKLLKIERLWTDLWAISLLKMVVYTPVLCKIMRQPGIRKCPLHGGGKDELHIIFRDNG